MKERTYIAIDLKSFSLIENLDEFKIKVNLKLKC